jgi:hypothetical protein
MTHQIDRSGGEGEIMTISNVIHIGLSIQLSISGRAMPEAEPYFEALRQHLSVEYSNAPVLDGYTYHLRCRETLPDRHALALI